jgi:hypothetical protein
MSQRQVECPFCTGSVLSKTAGRAFASISGFLQRSFKIRIPTEILTFLQENLPVSKKSLFKEPCEACKGKSSIPDPSDDTDKIAQVQANAKARAEEIIKLENELAPACGNRYTIIQGCDLLEVGLGMNDAAVHRVDKDKGTRAYGLADPGKLNTKKGGPVPQGKEADHVQSWPSLASPGGHYMIKCSNKFSLVVGAQGVDINSKGPINISGSVTRITAPELTIGTQTGRLLLEGQVVNINGKSVEVAPSDGHFFVKGTISNTGNMMCGGHAHMESASVTKLETTGKNEPSKPASAADIVSGPAFWGGMGVEAIQKTLMDTVGLVTSRIANPIEAQQMVSFRYIYDLRDKILGVVDAVKPWELKPTGVILPGNCVVVGSCTYGGAVVAMNPMLVPIYNFPHTHSMPSGSHNHETRVPDIECSADSAQELRSKQGGVNSNAPLHKTSTSATTMLASLWSAIGVVFAPVWTMLQQENSGGHHMKT